MALTRLRTRGALLAAVPVVALGLVGAGVLTAAQANERDDAAAQIRAVAGTLHDRHAAHAGQARRAADPGAAATSVLGDWNGDNRADLIGRDSAGLLWLYTGTGQLTRPFETRRQMGHGWQIYSKLVRHGDWNRDGKQDILARDTAGVLWFYQGTGAATGSGHLPRTRVGGGWNSYTQLVGVDDWTADGFDDLIAVDAAGKLWLYEGKATGADLFLARRQIGSGWQIYTLLTAIGDLGQDDGGTELVALDRNRRLWGYDSTGDPAQPYTVRYSLSPDTFDDLNAMPAVGDVDSGGLPDLLFRYNWGYLYVGSTETPDFVDPVGGGWNIYNALF